MNLSTVILDTANLHRFDNCDFNDEFLTVRNGGFVMEFCNQVCECVEMVIYIGL